MADGGERGRAEEREAKGEVEEERVGLAAEVEKVGEEERVAVMGRPWTCCKSDP